MAAAYIPRESARRASGIFTAPLDHRDLRFLYRTSYLSNPQLANSTGPDSIMTFDVASGAKVAARCADILAPGRPTAVRVVILTWEKHDLHSGQHASHFGNKPCIFCTEILHLRKLFEGIGYSTKWLSIPMAVGTHDQWLRNDFPEAFATDSKTNEHEMSILYYRGHGSLNERCLRLSSGSASIFCTKDPSSFSWHRVMKHFESSVKGDALIILDCCFAGAAANAPSRGTTKSLGLLAATNWQSLTQVNSPHSLTQVNSPHSLTRRLKDVLTQLRREQKPFSMLNISCRLAKAIEGGTFTSRHPQAYYFPPSEDRAVPDLSLYNDAWAIGDANASAAS